MTPAEGITALKVELEQIFAGCRGKLESFPSGAVSLDLWYGHRFFVMAYLPSEGLFCVDELGEDEGIGTHYRWGFPDLSSVREKIIEIMRSKTTLPNSDAYGKPLYPNSIKPASRER